MSSLAWWPMVALVGVASVIDLRSRRIPNWLVVPMLLAGLVLDAAHGGFPGLWAGLAGVALAAAVGGPLRYLGGMGMGDVKLLAAIGAWIGAGQLAFAMLVSAMAGGILAVAYAAVKRSFGSMFDRIFSLLCHFGHSGPKPHESIVLGHQSALSIPYAPAIALGTLFSFFAGFPR